MAEMKLKDFLPLLRKGLEDEEIRRMIRQIIAEQSAVNEADVSVQEYKAEIERLQTDCEKNRKAAEKANEERKAKSELAKQQEKQLSDLMAQLEHRNDEIKNLHQVIDKYKAEKEQFEADLNILNGKLDALEQACNKYKCNTDSLEKAIYEIKTRNEGLTKRLEHETASTEALHSLLVECFGEGYALYQKYQQISPYSHKLLAGVFHRDDFESFIIGGSQPDAPERIWDIMKYRIGDPELPVLWQIFVYFIGLCNKSSKEDIYAIENVQQGDEYDYERHAPDQNSKAQGRITEVKLQGYKNIYRDKYVRKSIVHVD